jgi:hypothetical protein
MDRSSAEAISKLMLEFSARLNDSVALMEKNGSPAEFEAYRSAIARIMGEMLLGIMNPLYATFPDLKPDGLE